MSWSHADIVSPYGNSLRSEPSSHRLFDLTSSHVPVEKKNNCSNNLSILQTTKLGWSLLLPCCSPSHPEGGMHPLHKDHCCSLCWFYFQEEKFVLCLISFSFHLRSLTPPPWALFCWRTGCSCTILSPQHKRCDLSAGNMTESSQEGVWMQWDSEEYAG